MTERVEHVSTTGTGVAQQCVEQQLVGGHEV